MSIQLAQYIPWLPALAAVLCGVCATHKRLRPAAAWLCIGSIAAAFLLAVGVAGQVQPFTGGSSAATLTDKHVVHFFDWISVGGFTGQMSYWLDPLTVIMLFVVTGIGSLVAIYAAGYMAGDKGYARFFAFVSLFIFAMTSLVMADNLVLLYLGWEGVGLCSYLLIGHYYHKPSAVAAAKKAFIVNRIGDLAFALGIFLVFRRYGSVQYADIFAIAQSGASADKSDLWIPFLLMLGAFGKSAQIPLHVWLPDAMEGPTPVSALIHAATMVTAGVYMIARLLPLFELSPAALPTVAVVGGVTAFFAATIALCQYDLKRVFAYSTISQLGYMFLGVGVLSTFGGVFHLFTHAFFKALLFLTAGSVMHACAGQLDMRKLSGLKDKMPVTCWLMFVGCLALAGFPLTAGFFSKDAILAATLEAGIGGSGGGSSLFVALAALGGFTALLTAFYTFRLWFRVFMGPEQYEMGDEAHSHEDAHKGAVTSVAAHSDEESTNQDNTHTAIEHHHEPHEMPWLMNGPLVVLAVGSVVAGLLFSGYVGGVIDHSTAGPHAAHAAGDAAPDDAHHATILGMSVHTAMMLLSGVISVVGILAAAWFHWLDRESAMIWARRYKGVVTLLYNKWYVDELYDAVIVRPLRGIAHGCYLFDRLVIEGLVSVVAFAPRVLGLSIRPMQRGVLQGYGLGMLAGTAAIVLLVWMAMG